MGKKHIKSGADPVGTDEVVKDERDALSTVPPDVFVPEDQRARWMKYGANVALASVAVLVLAGIVVWAFNVQSVKLGDRRFSLRGRADLTGDASAALKPQTKQLIQDLPADEDKAITLVSLYPKLKKEEAASKGADTYQRVRDILDEYQRNGRNIKTRYIDPVTEEGELLGWFNELKRKYGANIPNYERFLKEDAPKTVEELRAQTEAEAKQLATLAEQLESASAPESLVDQVRRLRASIASIPAELKSLNEAAAQLLTEKIPDYAAAVKVVRNGEPNIPGLIAGRRGLVTLSRESERYVETFTGLKDNKDAPESLRTYAAAAVPRFQALKAKADEALKKADSLGELKFDEVRKKVLPTEDGLAAAPAIVIAGKDDVRVVDDFSLWKSGETTGMAGARANAQPRLRFAGEQQLTSAILGLSQAKKQKVAFVRAGGPPMTTGGGGMMGGGGRGPFGEIADRLKSYNFDVVEKDLGPPNPMRQQMPNPNEPTDEELKDAVWIVFASEPQQDPRMGGMSMPGALGERLKQHLDGGGSALCLVNFQGEDLAPALKDWGIEVKPSTLIVHDRIEGGDANANDFIEQARREPPIFILNEFGEHPITTPIQSLDAAMVPLVPVKKAAAVPADVKVTEIIPIPQAPKAWGETDLASMQPAPGSRRPPPPPTFDPATDAPAPLFAGAAAEKQGKGRLVVIGSQNFAANTLVNLEDPALAKGAKPVIVSRFPGNGELVTNSVFWLARNEKMIALSPSAMDTARIESIPPGRLGFLKVGVVLVALPLMAVAAGVAVWMNRRG